MDCVGDLASGLLSFLAAAAIVPSMARTWIAYLVSFAVGVLLSAALLDTFHVAHVASTAMIFVSRKDGITHNEIENVRPERLDALAAVLVHSCPRGSVPRLDRR